MASVSSYRSKPDSSDDESSNDSDVWKRSSSSKKLGEDEGEAVVPVNLVPQELPLDVAQNDVRPPVQKRKANTIWSSVLQEQMMSEELGQCGLKRKPISFQNRGPESYDFRLKAFDTRPEVVDCGEGEMEEETGDLEEEEEDETVNGDKTKKPRQIFTKKKRFKLTWEELTVAKKIIRFLHEPKKQLIERIVHVIGAEKALSLMKMTEDIEDAGGMMIINGTRRRTPGGVYLQLLKVDKNITRKKKDEIFADEYNFPHKKKKFHKNKPKLPAKAVIDFVFGDGKGDIKQKENVPDKENGFQAGAVIIQEDGIVKQDDIGDGNIKLDDIEDGEIID